MRAIARAIDYFSITGAQPFINLFSKTDSYSVTKSDATSSNSNGKPTSKNNSETYSENTIQRNNEYKIDAYTTTGSSDEQTITASRSNSSNNGTDSNWFSGSDTSRTSNSQTVTNYKDGRKNENSNSSYEKWSSERTDDSKGIVSAVSKYSRCSSSYSKSSFKGGYCWTETVSGSESESGSQGKISSSSSSSWSWTRSGTVWDDGRNSWSESWSKSGWNNGKYSSESDSKNGSFDPKKTGQTNDLPKVGEAPRLNKAPKRVVPPELNKLPKPSKDILLIPTVIIKEPQFKDVFFGSSGSDSLSGASGNDNLANNPSGGSGGGGNSPNQDKIQKFIREFRRVMAQGKQAVIDFLKGFIYHSLINGVGLLKDVADLLYPPGAKSHAEIEAYYRNNLSFQTGRAVANGLTFLAGILGILLIGLTIGGSGGSALIAAPAQMAALVAAGNMTAASARDIVSIVSQVFHVNSGDGAGTFHPESRGLRDEEALSQGLRVHNRPKFSEKDMQGALPNPSGQAGHAGSKHEFPKQLQADIINNPDRVFIGINDNGRQVTVFYKEGNVVITQDNNFTRVITAYGRSAISKSSGGQVRPGTPVSPNRWISNPNYVEISK